MIFILSSGGHKGTIPSRVAYDVTRNACYTQSPSHIKCKNVKHRRTSLDIVRMIGNVHR